MTTKRERAPGAENPPSAAGPNDESFRVYLASSFGLWERVEALSQRLESEGFWVTVKWWSRDGFDLRDKKNDSLHPERFYADPVCGYIFHRDTAGVEDCQAFVFVAGDEPKAFNGANIEYGFALACGKPCFSIGQLENSALYWGMKRLHSEDELCVELRMLREAEYPARGARDSSSDSP